MIIDEYGAGREYREMQTIIDILVINEKRNKCLACVINKAGFTFAKGQM